MGFRELPVGQVQMNPFTKIASEWALLTAGTQAGFNMMTVSWASFGCFWGKDAVTAYVRESRYTRQFMESNDTFTLSFFGPEHRKALSVCGTLHGNQCDKVAESGLTPVFLGDAAAFEEASLVFVCRKLVHADFTRANADNETVFDAVYPEPDLHRIYIGEVLRVLETA